MTGPREGKTSYKTTGGADLPNTKQPKNSAAYDNTQAPFANGNDVSGYIGVNPEYKTYTDVRNKPLNVAGAAAPYAMSEEDEGDGLQELVAGSGDTLSGPVKHTTKKRTAKKAAPSAPKLNAPVDDGDKSKPSGTAAPHEMDAQGKPLSGDDK